MDATLKAVASGGVATFRIETESITRAATACTGKLATVGRARSRGAQLRVSPSGARPRTKTGIDFGFTSVI